MDFLKSIAIAASGLRAQAGRMRIISENIANADFDRAEPPAPSRIAARSRPSRARSTARSTRRSSRSAASRPIRPTSASSTSRAIRPPTQNGNVKYPNVNSLVEMMDLREAQRSYEANINVIGASRRMIQRTLDILKS